MQKSLATYLGLAIGISGVILLASYVLFNNAWRGVNSTQDDVDYPGSHPPYNTPLLFIFGPFIGATLIVAGGLLFAIGHFRSPEVKAQ